MRSATTSVIVILVAALSLGMSQAFAVEAAFPLPAKRIDRGGLVGEARLRLRNDAVRIGEDLIIECEFLCTSGAGDVYNGLLSERHQLPAQIVVTSADGSRRWELLQEAPEVVDAGLPLSEVRSDKQIALRSNEALGRSFKFRIAPPPNSAAGFTHVRSLDLPAGEYFVQAIYNGWLTARFPSRDEVETELAEPIAVSEPVHFTVAPPSSVRLIAEDAPTLPSSSVRLELRRLPLPAHVHRTINVEILIGNNSSEAIEVYNPLLNPLLWTNRAVSLNILDSEGKHVVDLLQQFTGSSISVGRKSWVDLPPGGFIVTGRKFDLSSDFWYPEVSVSSLSGSFKLQLAATDRLTLPRPRFFADSVGADRQRMREEQWYAALPGKIQVRSNAIEFKLPAGGDK